MNEKFFLVQVTTAAELSQPDEYLRHEIEQFAAALMEFHSRGAKPTVSVATDPSLVNFADGRRSIEFYGR